MAETWSVTPTEGAENLGGGKFKFTPPTSGSKTYTITYDDGKSTPATTTYTVNAGECVTCDCGKFNFTAVGNIASEGSNKAKLGDFVITNPTCESYPVTGEPIENVSDIVVEGNTMYGKVSKNTGEPRNIKFKVKFNGNDCEEKTIPQGTACGCSVMQLTDKVTSIPYYPRGATLPVAKIIMPDGCDLSKIGIVDTTSSEFKNEFKWERNGNIINIVVYEKPIEQYVKQRSFSYKITYDGSDCPGKTHEMIELLRPTDNVERIRITNTAQDPDIDRRCDSLYAKIDSYSITNIEGDINVSITDGTQCSNYDRWNTHETGYLQPGNDRGLLIIANSTSHSVGEYLGSYVVNCSQNNFMTGYKVLVYWRDYPN
jgi:hypothetical protein